MKETPDRQCSHFAEILNAGMQQLDITIRELSKQPRISREYARELQAGEVLPSRLLVESQPRSWVFPWSNCSLQSSATIVSPYSGRFLNHESKRQIQRLEKALQVLMKAARLMPGIN